ncbi:MAG: helix-turn-helix domain-containing protein, partial [bacterium]|nr:helix-turn-helix domain-containing protein [bacterium]
TLKVEMGEMPPSEQRAEKKRTLESTPAKKTVTPVRKKPPLSFHLADLPEEKPIVVSELPGLREVRYLSLEDVHQATKIPVRHLQALESGDRSFLPAINVRAFLRTLGRYYEVDWLTLNPPDEPPKADIPIVSLEDVAAGDEEKPDTPFTRFFLGTLLVVKRLKRRLINRDNGSE